MTKRLTVLDLFAGCGGLSKGLESAGLHILAANEIWEPAAATYRRNHLETSMIEGDVTDPAVVAEILKATPNGADILVGGPPCQAYSLSGRRDPTDPRGRLFEDYVALVEHTKPRAFAMENVKGLLSMLHDREDLKPAARKTLHTLRDELDSLPTKYTRNHPDRESLLKGRERAKALRQEMKEFQEPVTEMIVRRFQKLGYTVEFQVLNSADFGVPQRRERVIFLGVKSKARRISFPQATHSPSPDLGLFDSKSTWRTVRQSIEDLKDAPENDALHHVYPRHSEAFLEKIRRTPIGGSVFPTYSDAFYRTPPDEPSRTVKENHNGVFVHYDRDRVMTPRELARLQDFSDGFLFSGSKSIVLKQIGNAVPVGLGKAIGESLLELAG